MLLVLAALPIHVGGQFICWRCDPSYPNTMSGSFRSLLSRWWAVIPPAILIAKLVQNCMPMRADI